MLGSLQIEYIIKVLLGGFISHCYRTRSIDSNPQNELWIPAAGTSRMGCCGLRRSGAGGGKTASSVAVVAAKQPPHAEWSSTSELVAAKQPALAGGGGKTATRREVLTRPGRLAEVTRE